MEKSLIIIGKPDDLPNIQDFGLEFHEFSDENCLEFLSSLKKSDDLTVVACCIPDGYLNTIMEHKHQIARNGLEVFVFNFDNGCKSFEDLEKLAMNMIAEIIAATPVPEIMDFKLKEESILASMPKALFEETVRLPKERQYFVPRDQHLANKRNGGHKYIQRKILRK